MAGYTSDYADVELNKAVGKSKAKVKKAAKSKKIGTKVTSDANKKLIRRKELENTKRLQKGTPNDPNY